MMRVAVTGASGFAGGVIARWLAVRGFAVFPFGRRAADALRTPMARYRSWDVATGTIEGPEVDAVVHCAAHVGQWGDEEPYRAVNVRGTRNVLASFPAVDRFVHVSSASVYAPDGAKVRVREEARIGEPALTPYARTKAEGEMVVRASGRAAVILRPHIVYGPGDTTLWPRVAAARRLGWLPIPGDGRNRISVTHVFNLAHAVERALRVDAHAATYNVADAEEATVDELLRTLMRRQGLTPRIAYIPRGVAWRAAAMGESLFRKLRSEREPTLTRYVVANLADDCTLDISRARSALGYEPAVTFRDGALGE